MPPAASHPGIHKCCCLIGLPLLSLCCQAVTALAQQALHTILCKQVESENCKFTVEEDNYTGPSGSSRPPCCLQP